MAGPCASSAGTHSRQPTPATSPADLPTPLATGGPAPAPSDTAAVPGAAVALRRAEGLRPRRWGGAPRPRRRQFLRRYVYGSDAAVWVGQEHVAALRGGPAPADRWCGLAGRNGPEGLSETALTRLGRTRIGFVFEAFVLVSALSVRENILLPHRGPRTVARRGSSTVINESAAARIRWFLLGLWFHRRWLGPENLARGRVQKAEEGPADGTDPAEPFSRMRRSRSATRTSACRLAWAPGSRLHAGC